MNLIKTLLPILSLALLETACLAADEAPLAATKVTHIAKNKRVGERKKVRHIILIHKLAHWFVL